MADVVDPITRSRMMAGIRGRNTKPEIAIRKGLHARGFRFRLHGEGLAGRPDIVLAKYRAVIFVQGCFWHGHGCALFKWPATRPAFWKDKIESNIARDARTKRMLIQQEWRVMRIWECALRGPHKVGIDQVLDTTASWLIEGGREADIRGTR